MFKSLWYLNSRITNSRRIVILNMPSWEQSGEVIQIANGALTSTQMEGKSILFSIDTGAEVTVIPETVHKKIGSPHLQPSGKTSERSCWQ